VFLGASFGLVFLWLTVRGQGTVEGRWTVGVVSVGVAGTGMVSSAGFWSLGLFLGWCFI
jgi:hypothetical protein